MRLVQLGFVLSLLAGCATPAGGEGWAELGTGEWRFEPLVDEQHVPLVFGPQGGYHVWTSVRAEGLVPEDVTLEIATEPVDGSSPEERSTVVIDLQQNEDGGDALTSTFIGFPAVLSRPGCMTERAMHLSVHLTDARGVTAEDARVIVPMPGAHTPPPCD